MLYLFHSFFLAWAFADRTSPLLKMPPAEEHICISSGALSIHQLTCRQSHMQDNCVLEDAEAKHPLRKPYFCSGCVTWDDLPGLLLTKRTDHTHCTSIPLNINMHFTFILLPKSTFHTARSTHFSSKTLHPSFLTSFLLVGRLSVSTSKLSTSISNVSGCFSRHPWTASLVYAAVFSLLIAHCRTTALAVSHISFWKDDQPIAYDSEWFSSQY